MWQVWLLPKAQLTSMEDQWQVALVNMPNSRLQGGSFYRSVHTYITDSVGNQHREEDKTWSNQGISQVKWV